MSRRQCVLGGCILLLVFLNCVIFWRRFREPLEAHPGDSRNQAAQVVIWAEKPALELNRPAVEVIDVVAHSSQGGCPDDPDVAAAGFDQLSSDEIRDLYSAVAGLLQCYAKLSSIELIAYMKGRNEHFDPERLALMKELAIQDGFVTREQLEAVTDADFGAKFWHWWKCDPHWEAVVESTGCVFIWRCHDPQETIDHPLASKTHKFFHNIGNYAHMFRPDIEFKEACMQAEGVLIADVKIVIQHDEALKKERSPYFVRFWHSRHDNLWHPIGLSHVSTAHAGPDAIVKLMF